MTIRQGIVLFTFSTIKTVDDHCGYALPFDPLQWLFRNNASYHDVHHQVRLSFCNLYNDPFNTVFRLGVSSTTSVNLSTFIGTRFSERDTAGRVRHRKTKTKISKEPYCGTMLELRVIAVSPNQHLLAQLVLTEHCNSSLSHSLMEVSGHRSLRVGPNGHVFFSLTNEDSA